MTCSLLEALEKIYPDCSKRTLLQWLKWGRVTVEGEIIKRGDFLLNGNQMPTLHQKEVIKTFRGIRILYEDRWIVAIDKPPNLLSVATDNNNQVHALGLVRHYLKIPALYAVHRIDRETSGVLLFARGKLSEEAFDALFEKHALTREYTAIVEGRMPSDEGTWQSYLLEKENYDVITTTEDLGKRAITHYAVFRRSKKFTYLRLRLETGRKHQIRVHCKEAGFPILGDKRYGSDCNPVHRMCLHASLLQFIHPFTGKELCLTSPLPRAFTTLGADL